MKRFSMALILTAASLSLSSCQSESLISGDIEFYGQSEAISSEIVDDFSTDSAQSTEPAPDPQTVSGNNSDISISYFYDSKDFYSEDRKTVLLECAYSYPKIRIKERDDLTAKINGSIQEQIRLFLSHAGEITQWAQSDYDGSTDIRGYTFHPYSTELAVRSGRCDSQVVSFVLTISDDTGGAHGNVQNFGLNYNAKSGDILRLSDLSYDSGAFCDMLYQTLSLQHEDDAYSDYIYQDTYILEFDTENDSDPISVPIGNDIKTTLLTDDKVSHYYFDRSGLSFLSDPYALGPYAAGTFEFYIPYTDLTGLKEEFAYAGRFEQKIFPGRSAKCDLNGDGLIDAVCYDTKYNADYSYISQSLTINNKDFSSQLSKLAFEYPQVGFYSLLDLDESDPYVEIAIADDSSGKPASTYIFRYMQDYTLTCLGKVEGILYHDINNIVLNPDGSLTAE